MSRPLWVLGLMEESPWKFQVETVRLNSSFWWFTWNRKSRKKNIKLQVTLETGLVCYDQPKNGEDGQKCPNYEVRFCCEEEKDLSCLLHRPPFHPVRPNPEWLPPNDCCGERPYNTNLKVSDHFWLYLVLLGLFKYFFKTCCKPGNRLVESEIECPKTSY